MWRKIPDLCIGWKKWLSAPDSNQWCLPGCITTIFSPGIIVVWIWNDNAAPKVDGCESGMTPTVLPQFPSTGPKLMSCPCWYTRSAFPVPTHLLFHLVHQKHVSCTNGAPQYIRCIQRPHHVHFLFYGAIGDPFFQVWKVMRTYNSIRLIANELVFQVWIYSHT